MRILIINGPNINLIGEREKEIYGTESYDEMMEKCKAYARENRMGLSIFQSNHEGDLIDRIHNNDFDFLVGNFGAFTHYSYAIRDAILAIKKPFIEVHLSNIFSRDEWRKNSVLSDIAIGVISGFGEHSYLLALKYLNEVRADVPKRN